MVDPHAPLHENKFIFITVSYKTVVGQPSCRVVLIYYKSMKLLLNVQEEQPKSSRLHL
jgi:hypothetical protein